MRWLSFSFVFALLLGALQVSSVPLPSQYGATRDISFSAGPGLTYVVPRSPSFIIKFRREDGHVAEFGRRNVLALFSTVTKMAKFAPTMLKATGTLGKIIKPITTVMTKLSPTKLITPIKNVLTKVSPSNLIKGVKGASSLGTVAKTGATLTKTASTVGTVADVAKKTSTLSKVFKVFNVASTVATVAIPVGGFLLPKIMGKKEEGTTYAESGDPDCKYKGPGPGLGIDTKEYTDAFAQGITEAKKQEFYANFCSVPELSEAEFTTLVNALNAAPIISDDTSSTIKANGDENCPYQGAGSGLLSKAGLSKAIAGIPKNLSAEDAAKRLMDICNTQEYSREEFTALVEAINNNLDPKAVQA